jgi:hypothetical protein
MKKEIKLGIIAVAVVCIMASIAIGYVINVNAEMTNIMTLAKTMNVDLPQNSTLIYNYVSGISKPWYIVDVTVNFPNAPWNNYGALLWFKSDGTNYLERM